MVAAVALSAQVLKASASVKLPSLDAVEAVMGKAAASTPPAGVAVDPGGTGVPDSVRLSWTTAYRGGAARQVVFRLSGSDLVADDGAVVRVLASGVSKAAFSTGGTLLRVCLEGPGWAWDREFALLGGG